MSFVTHNSKTVQKNKKKPPPRPPPPNLAKYKSKSSYNLNLQNENLIEWSPPNSPTVERTHTFGGSVSSSFSSSTSSLASSKKSFECDLPITNSLWPVNLSSGCHTRQTHTPVSNISSQQSWQHAKVNGGSTSGSAASQFDFSKQNGGSKINVPAIFGPTIIRAQVPRSKVPNELKKQDSNPPSPPMPSVPPPSPPKEAAEIDVPFGIALYDYPGTDSRDLSFQANDVIILLRQINDEWLYGRVLDKEGMFPANFIEIQVPLTQNDNNVLALYEFCPQMAGDLALKPGQLVTVLRKINDDWLYGEANGQRGQFPSNFVDRVPDI